MPILVVGKTEIPYEVRRSGKARRKRIVITPGKVEIVAPEGAANASIETFAHQQRRWIFDMRQEVEAKARQLESQGPSRFVTGAKIPYRGRKMRLSVEEGESNEVQVLYRNGFVVRVPDSLPPLERNGAISAALTFWLKKRVSRDVDAFVRHYGKPLGVTPKGVRVKEQKHLWGSCGRDGIINLNWHLIFAPKPVLEYAVVHELCHLGERNHSPAFWQLVGSLLPDYELRKKWLEDNDGLLKSGFITPATEPPRLAYSET